MWTVAAFLEKLPLLGSLREIPLSSQRVFPVRTAQGLTPRVADTQHHFLCQENVAIISQKQTQLAPAASDKLLESSSLFQNRLASLFMISDCLSFEFVLISVNLGQR